MGVNRSNHFRPQILRRYLGAVLLYLILIFTFGGCSHTRPYYRKDIAAAPRTVELSGDQIRARLLLIGDAGAPRDGEPVLQTLAEWVNMYPQKTMAVFLGDNIYPDGIPGVKDPAGQEEAKARLSAQINTVKGTAARALFIPGNHDWARGHPDGYRILKRQEDFVNILLPGADNFLPKDGCPGPVALDWEGVRIIVLDTQWWLHRLDRFENPCALNDSAAVLAELTRLLEGAGEREVVVVGHHPLASRGPHGGFFTWKDHLFPLTNLSKAAWLPLPVIGSLYPVGRRYWFKSRQDLFSQTYGEMIGQLNRAFAARKPLIYAAGHDHSLQVMEGASMAEYTLVSGAGSETKATEVGHKKETLFAHQHPGFMVIDFLNDGRILLRVAEPDAGSTLLAHWLR